MKKSIIACVLLILLSLLIMDPAMAADVFASASGDTSTSKLVDPLTASPKIASLFGNFNTAVLFLGGILTAYGIFAGIAQTAHDGEMLGRRWSSLWVPIRISLGIAAIVPVGNGYCAAQQAVIYVAQMGVGAASGMWSMYVDADQNEIQTTSNPTEIAGVRELALSLLKSHFCTLNYQTIAGTDTENNLNLEKTVKVIDFGEGQFSFGTDEDKEKCGSYIIPDYSQDTTGIGIAQGNAFVKLNERMMDVATKIYTNSTTPDGKQNDPKENSKEINNAIREYSSIVGYAAQSYVTASALQTKMEAKTASIGGWIKAGAYSASKGKATATAGEMSSNLPKAAASAAPPQLSAAVSTPNKENSTFIDSVSDKVASLWNAGNKIVKTTVSAAMDMVNDPNMIVTYAKEPFQPLIGAIKGIMNGTGNPISNVQILGGAAIEVSALLVVAAIALGIFTTTGGLALLGLAGILFSFGAINYFFLPIMPALYYYSAVIGWYVLFIECLIAAPIWALMHIKFDGEGMVGSAASGYKIILNMFLRPSLITIAYGIALGSLEFLVSGWNQVFASAVSANFDLSAVSLKPFFILTAEFVVYTITMIGIIYQVLKLITHIPEAITKWIDGGHDGFGSSTSETMHRVGHSGSAAAAGALAGMASSMGRNGGKKSGDKGGGDGNDSKSDETPPVERDGGGGSGGDLGGSSSSGSNGGSSGGGSSGGNSSNGGTGSVSGGGLSSDFATVEKPGASESSSNSMPGSEKGAVFEPSKQDSADEIQPIQREGISSKETQQQAKSDQDTMDRSPIPPEKPQEPPQPQSSERG